MPPRTPKPTGPTPVEAIVHPDKRANLPTADAQEFVTPDVQEQVRVAYPRDLHSPMLVWQGKEALDDSDLDVDAPPIYIQEKIDPRVLVEHLRDTAKAGEPEPELSLFESFDGLGPLDRVEFYKHEANWANRMILGDSLQVMASLAERERLRGKVQMIYLDPPLRHQVRLQLAGVSQEARCQGRQARRRRQGSRTDQGVPRYLGAGHQ